MGQVAATAIRALADVARLGPFFTLTVPALSPLPHGGHAFAALELPEGAALLREQVARAADRLGAGDGQPVASMLHLGAAAAIASPLLAVAAVHGIVLDLQPEQLRFSFRSVATLDLTLTDPDAGWLDGLLPEAAGALVTVLERLLGAFTAALTASHPLPPAIVAGNALSALAASAKLIEPAAAARRAKLLVDLMARRSPVLHGAGVLHWQEPDGPGYFRRSNCCLFYRLPGGGLCGDCVLDR